MLPDCYFIRLLNKNLAATLIIEFETEWQRTSIRLACDFEGAISGGSQF